ncbi:MAG: ThuA domain-containing protein [Chitinophagaceae bacterium]
MKPITRFSLFLVISAMTIGLVSLHPQPKPRKILVYTKTNGFRHSCIEVGVAAIRKLGEENGFVVDTTSDSLRFEYKKLKGYAAIMFFQTTGDVLGPEQEKAFVKYIQSGGGFVGVHAAADTEYNWPWFNHLVGAYFKDHPAQQQALLQVVDTEFPATKNLPRDWSRWDEWYNYKSTQWDRVKVLIKLDEKTIKGGGHGDNHPIAWYHYFDGGRSFYTGLGHTEASYTDELFLGHLLGGIKFAMEGLPRQ